MMKRLVTWLFFIGLFAVVAVLIVPSFINWNEHKAIILSQIEPYIQRKIDVTGNVHFALFPNPQISLENVTLAGAVDGAEPLLKLKSLEARVSLRPLLEGRVIVENINFTEPDINLEITADGSANWHNVLVGKPVNGSMIELNQISMTGGTIHYKNAITGTVGQVDKLNLSVAADTLLGPYKAMGDMVYNNSPVNIEITTGKYDGKSPVSTAISFQPVEFLPEVKFTGAIDPAHGFDAQGEVTLAQGAIASLLPANFFNDIPFLHDIADAHAMVEVTGNIIKISSIKSTFGKNASLDGSVNIELRVGQKPFVTANLTGNGIAVSNKVGFMNAPDVFDGVLTLQGKNISWNGLRLDAAQVVAEAARGEWVVKDGSLTMAGASTFKFNGLVTPKTKNANIVLDVTADDLSQVIVGLPFKQMALQGSLDIGPEKISLYNFTATMSQQKMAGVVTVNRLAEKFAAEVNVSGAMPGADNFALKGVIDDRLFTGEISADKIDFDHLNRAADLSLMVKAKTFVWRNNDISDASFKLETLGGKTKLSALQGKMWGGDLTADAEAGALKGKLVGADLDKLRDLMEFKGFTLGTGNIEFDVKDNGATDTMFGAVSGVVTLHADKIKIEKFSLAEVPQVLKSFAEMPASLSGSLEKSMGAQGDTTYKNVDVTLNIADGKISVDSMKLADDKHEMFVSGVYDLSPETYDISAVVKLTDIPSFTIARKTPDAYKVDASSLEKYVRDHLPKKVEPIPEPVPAPIIPAPVATPSNAIGDILNRLDDEDLAVDPAPVIPTLPTPEDDILPLEEGGDVQTIP